MNQNALSSREPAGRRGSFALVQRQSRGIVQNWMVEGGLTETLLGPDGLRLAEWASQKLLSIVKTGPHRTVYRLRLDSGEFFIKHVRTTRWVTRLKGLLRPNQAEREWTAAERLARLGIPTFQRAALGRVRGGGMFPGAFLITRAIPRALPIDAFLDAELPGWPASARAVARQALARELGRLLATLHGGGIEHGDLHAANFLVRIEPHGPLSLWLIDLHAARFRRRMNWSCRMANLALLYRSFARRATAADRWRFWRAYLDATGLPRPGRHQRGRLLDQQRHLGRRLIRSVLAGWRRADAAWARGNRHVRIMHANARALAALDGLTMAELCQVPEQLFAADHVRRWCKRTARRRVVEAVLPIGTQRQHIYAKCVERPAAWPQRLVDFRWKWGRRAWETGHAMLRRGIDTPRPLFFIDCQLAGATRSYLATEALPAVLPLDQFLKCTWPLMSPAERRSWLAAHGGRLARQLRLMHACGFDHRDLKFSNLLVSADPRDARTWILDLEGVRRWRRMPRQRAVQNLGRLAVSGLAAGPFQTTDFLRFLRGYLGEEWPRCGKAWWRAIARACRRKVARNQSSGRSLT